MEGLRKSWWCEGGICWKALAWKARMACVDGAELELLDR